MDNSFWTGYRRNVALHNEVLSSVFIPFTTKVSSYKNYPSSSVTALYPLQFFIVMFKSFKILRTQ